MVTRRLEEKNGVHEARRPLAAFPSRSVRVFRLRSLMGFPRMGSFRMGFSRRNSSQKAASSSQPAVRQESSGARSFTSLKAFVHESGELSGDALRAKITEIREDCGVRRGSDALLADMAWDAVLGWVRTQQQQDDGMTLAAGFRSAMARHRLVQLEAARDVQYAENYGMDAAQPQSSPQSMSKSTPTVRALRDDTGAERNAPQQSRIMSVVPTKPPQLPGYSEKEQAIHVDILDMYERSTSLRKEDKKNGQGSHADILDMYERSTSFQQEDEKSLASPTSSLDAQRRFLRSFEMEAQLNGELSPER